MRHPVIKTIGYLLIGLVLLCLALIVAQAIRSGQTFYGTNYWQQPLGVYPTLAVLVVAAVVGVWVAVRRVRAWLRRPRSS